MAAKDSDYMAQVGERLKLLRTRAGMMQKQVALAMGIAPSTMTRYETGQIQPDLQALCWYADTFSVTVDWILGRTLDDKITKPALIERDYVTAEQVEDILRRVLREERPAPRPARKPALPKPMVEIPDGGEEYDEDIPLTPDKRPDAEDAIAILYKPSMPKPGKKKDGKEKDKGKKKKKK